MRKILLRHLAIMSCLIWAHCDAGVVVESRCYGYQVRAHNESQFSLRMNIYRDEMSGKEIGANVQYRENAFIPIAYWKTEETDEDKVLGNYQIHRVEVIGGKITGEYVNVRTGAGIKQGSYLLYKKYNDRKQYIFFENEGERCIEVCEAGKCKFN